MARRRRCRDQRGQSLLEAVIAVGIAGITILTVIGAVLLMIKGSNGVNDRGRMQVAISSITDNVRQSSPGGVSYKQCASPAEYFALLSTANSWLPAETNDLSLSVATASDIVVEYWSRNIDGLGVEHPAFNPSSNGCSPTAGRGASNADEGAQRITITTRWTDTSVSPAAPRTAKVVVIKRDQKVAP